MLPTYFRQQGGSLGTRSLYHPALDQDSSMDVGLRISVSYVGRNQCRCSPAGRGYTYRILDQAFGFIFSSSLDNKNECKFSWLRDPTSFWRLCVAEWQVEATTFFEDVASTKFLESSNWMLKRQIHIPGFFPSIWRFLSSHQIKPIRMRPLS